MNDIMNCLKSRSAWYGKAISLVTHEIPWENGFDFPPAACRGPFSPENLYFWMGAKKEIDNTIDMMEHESRMETV